MPKSNMARTPTMRANSTAAAPSSRRSLARSFIVVRPLFVRRSLTPPARPGARATGGRPLVDLGAVDSAADVVELAARRRTDEGHSRDDHHRNKGHHQRVLNRRCADLLRSPRLEAVPPGGNTRVETK